MKQVLFVLAGVILLALLLPSVFAVSYQTNISTSIVAGNDSNGNYHGYLFKTNTIPGVSTFTLNNATMYTQNVGFTECVLWNKSSNTVIANVTNSGNVCQFNTTIYPGQEYFISGSQRNTAGYQYTRLNSITAMNGRFINISQGAYKTGASAIAAYTQGWHFQTITISDGPVPDVYYPTNFTAYNVYTGAAINSFCLNISGQYNCTTSGVASIPTVLSNSAQLWTVELRSNESGGYYNVTFTDVNVSANRALQMTQSRITFQAQEIITSSVISGATFNTTNLTNTTHYMSAAAWQVTAQAAGYVSNYTTYTAVAKTTATVPITGLYDWYYNVTAKNFYTNSSLSSFTVVISNSQNGYNQTYTTVTGTVRIPWLKRLPANITIMSSESGGYFNTTYAMVNTSTTSVFYPAQSAITFTAIERITGATISGAMFNTTALTNTTHYMSAAAWQVTAQKSGYYSNYTTYTAVARSTATVPITGLYNWLYNVTAKDFYTNSALSNFSVRIVNQQYGYDQTFSTTTGTIQIPWIKGILANMSVSSTQSGGYFNLTENSVNTTTNSQFALAQSAITFQATEKVSGTVLGGVSFATSQLTNGTHYMNAATYAVTASKVGYFNNVFGYTATALSTASYNINLTATKLNLTVRNALSNALVNNYVAQLNLSNYSYSENQSTTNGTVYADLIAGNATIFVDAPGYAYKTVNATLSAGMNNVTVYIFTTESVGFRFVDEQSGNIVNTTSVRLELIGSAASYNQTTTNGTIYQDLITPDSYTLRYSATGYNTRFGFVTVTNRTTQNVTLYMLASANATNVTATVYRQDGNEVANALVKVLKYDLATNSYIVREQVLTNFEGDATFSAQLNTEYYKFIVESPVGTVALTTEPSYLMSSVISLVLPGGTEGSNYVEILNLNGQVTYNAATGNFRFDASDSSPSITQACIYAYRVEENMSGTYLNSSCTSSVTGGWSILLGVNNISGYQYYAKGYVTMNGVVTFVDEAWADLTTARDFGALGLVVAVLLTVTIVMGLLALGPVPAILGAPIGITITNVAGMTYFSVWVPVALWVTCIIIAFVLGRNR